nr:Retrovirus-related Pol polyprotein from transposon TNT 1-94 [Ipomoea batatas]
MESSESVEAYIRRVLTLTNDMKALGEAFTEQVKVEKILRSLSSRFEHIVAAIEEANDVSTLTLKCLSGSLRAHEQRMNENKVEKPIEQALQAQVAIGQKPGTSRGRGWGRGGNSSNRGRGGYNNYHGAHGGNDQEKSNHHQNSRGRVEVGTKLSKEGDDQYVDSTHFKQIVGSLSDWGGDLDDRKSTSGYCFMLGTTACSWSSKKI